MGVLVDYTPFCLFGIATGFSLSLLMWIIGLVPRAIRFFLR